MESTSDILRYAHMWTTERQDWVLLDVGNGADRRPRYLILDRKDKGALIIEDDEVAGAVEDKMLKHGCEVVGPEILEN
jgi:hypothetical protein